MSEEKNSFVFYRSFHDAIKVAPKKHQLALFLALTDYVFENKTPQLESTSLAIWNAIKPQVDSSLKRYENAKKGAVYGKLGGRPKKKKDSDEKEEKKPLKGIEKKTLDSDLYSDSDSYLDSYSDSDVDVDVYTPPNPLKGAAGEGFQIPSLSEVREYCQERQNSVDPEEFLDFYTSKGWLIGKTPMKDWKACVRTWEKNQRNKTAPDRYSDVDDWLRRRTGNESAGI